MNIGQKLKELRINIDLTQDEVANGVGIARVNYTRYETGKNRPDYEVLVKLADFFDTSTDYLLDKEEY